MATFRDIDFSKKNPEYFVQKQLKNISSNELTVADVDFQDDFGVRDDMIYRNENNGISYAELEKEIEDDEKTVHSLDDIIIRINKRKLNQRK